MAICLLADEIIGERKYRIQSTDFHRIKSFHEKTDTGAYSYMPSNYKLLEKVLWYINTLPHNHSFLDIGCGRGRAMAVAATFGFNKIMGIDMIEDYCQHARDQLQAIQAQHPELNYEVVCGDATVFPIPQDIQIIFLYNPFEEWVLQRVIRNILMSREQAPRNIFVIYINPCFPYALLNSGFKEIYQTTRFRHLKASVFALTA